MIVWFFFLRAVVKTIAQTFDASLNHPLATLQQKPFENIQIIFI
jgi:hypothetical protein